MKRIPLLILSICAISAFGQPRLSVHLGTNAPLIHSIQSPVFVYGVPVYGSSISQSYSVGTLKESYKSKGGIYFSADLELPMSSKFFIRTGLLSQLIRFERTIAYDRQDGMPEPSAMSIVKGVPIGELFGFSQVRPYGQLSISNPKPNGNVTTTFLQVPVAIGRRFLQNRVSVAAGATAGYLVYASSYKTESTYSYPNGYFIIQEEKKKSNADFTTFSTGAIAQIEYLFAKNFSFGIVLQKNFTALYTSHSQFAGKSKLNAVSLTLGYRFAK